MIVGRAKRAWIAGLLAAGGCTPRDAPLGDVVVRDSAGVEVVESRTAAGQAAEWTVAAEPRPALPGPVAGGVPAADVTAGARLADGRVVLATGSPGELRIFAPDGSPMGLVGGDGEGEMELRFPAGVWPLAGDSLLVWDLGLRSLIVLRPDGSPPRAIPLERPGLNPQALGPFDDGTFLLLDDDIRVPRNGPVQQYLHLLRHGPDGRFLDTLGTHPSFVGVPVDGLGDFPRVERPVFGARTVAALHGDRYHIGTADAYEVRTYGADGRLLRIARWEGEPRDVGPSDVDRLRERLLAAAADAHERAVVEELFERGPVEAVLPAYAWMLADADGNLWLRPSDRPAAPDRVRWTVLDPAGRLLAGVTLPASLELLHVGSDHVLAADRTPGRERVGVWELRR